MTFEKARLLAKILQTDLNTVLLQKPELEPEQAALFADLETKLGQGFPLDYLLGEVQFLDLFFAVDENTLIPRPETEFWVKNLSVEWQEDEKRKAEGEENSIKTKKEAILVDLGCGSGIIGLSLAKYFGQTYLLDVSSEALAVAEKNAQRNAFIKQISSPPQFICSHLLTNFSLPEKDWFLLANLPYLPEKNREEAVQNRVQFEPALALYSGENGLDLVEETFGQLKDNFAVNLPQEIYLELDPGNIFLAQEMAQDFFPKFYQTQIWLDENGLDRVLVCKHT